MQDYEQSSYKTTSKAQSGKYLFECPYHVVAFPHKPSNAVAQVSTTPVTYTKTYPNPLAFHDYPPMYFIQRMFIKFVLVSVLKKRAMEGRFSICYILMQYVVVVHNSGSVGILLKESRLTALVIVNLLCFKVFFRWSSFTNIIIG